MCCPLPCKTKTPTVNDQIESSTKVPSERPSQRSKDPEGCKFHWCLYSHFDFKYVRNILLLADVKKKNGIRERKEFSFVAILVALADLCYRSFCLYYLLLDFLSDMIVFDKLRVSSLGIESGEDGNALLNVLTYISLLGLMMPFFELYTAI